jgi:hypothetical protein
MISSLDDNNNLMRISDDPADKELSISSDMAARMPTPLLSEFLKSPGMSMLLVAILSLPYIQLSSWLIV